MSSKPLVEAGLHGRTPHEVVAHHRGHFKDDHGRRPRFASQSVADETEVSPDRAWYVGVKAVTDFVLGLFLLLVTLPIVAVAAVLVKLSSRGPAFYCQQRAGKYGREFTLIKLRTMVENAEANTGAVWAVDNDPRITPLGRILRATHIDEFPQLLNVVLGQMSLVGPRPERPEFVSKLEWEIPFYRQRLQVRPGITGLAQVRLPPDTTIDSVRRKVIHDLYYVKHMNPWLDLLLLWATGWALVKFLGRRVVSCVSLPSQPLVETEFSSLSSASSHDNL